MKIRFWWPRFRKGLRPALALILALVLSPCFAEPASAHSGEGNELHGPAPAWMIGLIYLQLFMIPNEWTGVFIRGWQSGLSKRMI